MEDIYNDILDEYFKENLLNSVKFIFENKSLKEGVLVSYKQDDYEVCFSLKLKNGDVDDFYAPIPLKIESHKQDKLIYFDYRVKTFCKNNLVVFNLLTEFVKKQDPHEYYNKILEIKLG